MTCESARGAVLSFDMLASLIPESFFRDVPLEQNWLLWLLSAGGIAVLVFGADRAVSAAVRLAAALGMSKVIIGATVVSLGTTSPEAAVSVAAAFKGDGGLALGNGVGSIICDTALIFGLCCCITRLPKDRFVLHRHGWLQFGAGALLTVVLFVLWAIAGDINSVKVPRAVGILFIVLLVGYLYLSVRWSRRHPEMVPEEAGAASPKNHKPRRVALNLALLILGLAMVVGGSEVLVGSVREMCSSRRYGVPESIVAVTLVALGTSLPELATAIAAIVKGHADLLVGNIIGADILNVLFVIGVSATAMPLDVDPVFFFLLIPFMMVSLALLRAYIFMRGDTFRRWQGGILLALYVVFVCLAIQFGVMN